MRFKLDVDRSSVDDDTLLEDLARAARTCGSKSPTMNEYQAHGSYHPTTLIKRFGSWADALKRAGLAVVRHNAGIDMDDAKTDLRNVASKLNKSTLTQADYKRYGRFSASTISKRFGSWNDALAAADLKPSREYRILNDELFENLERMWIALGRQPNYGEVEKPFSAFSTGVYESRFGSWRKALEAFVAFAEEPPESQPAVDEVPPQIQSTEVRRRRTPRTANLRLRWKVFKRDRFTCCGCGRSPATTPGLEIQADHVVPWGKGGETVLDNLQTLCSECNQGKSNLV